MIYVRVDRKFLYAESYKEMVFKLMNISWDTACNKKEYMFNVAKRVVTLYDKYIENYKYEGFVRAMSRLTLIQLIKCSDCDHFCMDIKLDDYYCSKGIKGNFDPDNIECPFMWNKLIQKLSTDINKNMKVKSKHSKHN